jgi:hypothetical protein
MSGTALNILNRKVKVRISSSLSPEGDSSIQVDHLALAGQVIYGHIQHPQSAGWFSPTYLSLSPAYSFQVSFLVERPTRINTRIEIESTKLNNGQTSSVHA